jgi:CRISPR-associated protein Cas2
MHGGCAWLTHPTSDYGQIAWDDAMKVYLVCYDISDDDLRDDVSKILGEYGDRVQRSVFEVALGSEADLLALRQRLSEAMQDNIEVRFYRICERCREESHTLSGEPVTAFPGTIIV